MAKPKSIRFRAMPLNTAHRTKGGKEAEALGFRTYNTGKPCSRGHTSDRYASNSVCMQCMREINNPANRKAKNKHLRKTRGLPEPTRPEPGYCECCGAREAGGRGNEFHLDHCHQSGIFRGWLCARCNLGIGRLGDTIESIERVLEYLKRAYQNGTVIP